MYGSRPTESEGVQMKMPLHVPVCLSRGGYSFPSILSHTSGHCLPQDLYVEVTLVDTNHPKFT